MTEDYSANDLTWGIALHAVIGVVLGVGIFVQGLIDEGSLLFIGFGMIITSSLLAVVAALPVAIINSKRISDPIVAAKCSAISCGIGFVIMWVILSLFLMLSFELLTDDGIGNDFSEIFFYLFIGLISAGIGGAGSWICNIMVFHSAAVPVVAAQPQAGDVASPLTPSYVSTSETVQGGRDLYDWEIAEKKHDDRLGRIPRF